MCTARLRTRALERPIGRVGRAVANLRHVQRRVDELCRRRQGHEVLTARSDRPRQLRRSRDRLGVDHRRPRSEPLDAGRRRVVGAARCDRRFPGRRQAGSLPARPPPRLFPPAGDSADGGRRPLLQHAALAGCRGRRDDRRDALGLQPEELRGRNADDERPLVAAGRRLLDRRRGGRTHLVGNRQRLPRLRRGEDRRAVRGVRHVRTTGWSTRWSACRARTGTNATT